MPSVVAGSIREPGYYHRDYANDTGKQSDKIAQPTLLDRCKRVGVVALPFLTLYKPLSMPISLAMGGLRTITCLTQLGESIKSKDAGQISYAMLQTAVSVVALAGTIFAHPLGMLITTGHDLIIDLAHLIRHLSEGEYKQAMGNCLGLVNNALYLTLFLHGGLEVAIASLAMQIIVGLYHSHAEFQKGNYLEATGHILMGTIRGNQLVGQVKSLQIRNEVQKAIEENTRNSNEGNFKAKSGQPASASEKKYISIRGEKARETNATEKASISAQDPFIHKLFHEAYANGGDSKKQTEFLALVKQGADVNALDTLGRSLLYKSFFPEYAARRSSSVPLLLDHGADANFRYGGKSVLHLFLESSNKSQNDTQNILRSLLSKNADMNYVHLNKAPTKFCFEKYKSTDGSSSVFYLSLMDVFFEYGHPTKPYLSYALDYAISARHNSDAFLEILLKHKVDINGNSQIMSYFITKKSMSRIHELIQKGALLDSTHFYLSIKYKKMELIQILIDRKIDINSIGSLDGKHFPQASPVRLAIQDNNIDALIILNTLGANLNKDARDHGFLVDRDLMKVIKRDTLFYLAENGADLNELNGQKLSPLYFAWFHRNSEIFMALIDLGANLDKNISIGAHTTTIRRHVSSHWFHHGHEWDFFYGKLGRETYNKHFRI